jgi:hypothetical protein
MKLERSVPFPKRGSYVLLTWARWTPSKVQFYFLIFFRILFFTEEPVWLSYIKFPIISDFYSKEFLSPL